MLDPSCVWSSQTFATIDTMRVKQQTKGTLTVTLTDSSGSAIDLSSYDSTDEDTGVWLVAKDYATDTEPLLLVEVEITNAASGEVKWTYDASQTKYPGLWLAQFLLVSNDDTEQIVPYYLEITPNLNARTTTAYYPLTVAEVRIYLRDTSADANRLLDATEFEDAEIAYAIRRPIDQWNETPPPTRLYSTTNFPYRYYWTIGAASELLKIAAYHYERNNLNYSITGGAVNDMDKASPYMRLAKDLENQFMTWMMREKIRQSAMDCNTTMTLL